MSSEHIYAVTRVHYHEQKLLSNAVFGALLTAGSHENARRILASHGLGASGEPDGEMLARIEADAWALMRELTGENDELAPFKIENDYHNLKTAIKSVLTRTDVAFYREPALISGETAEKCVRSDDYSALRAAAKEAARQAATALKQTEDGQLCDMILDRACLEELWASTEKADPVFRLYAGTVTRIACVKIVLRSLKTGKGREFLEKALPEAGEAPKSEWLQAARGGADGVKTLLRRYGYRGEAEALERSLTAFETAARDGLTDLLQPQKSAIDTIGPVAAYLWAVLCETRALRILLTGLSYGLSREELAERMGKAYV